MTGQQRHCPACDSGFSPATSRQRFCSTRCRQSWWAARRQQATAALARHDTRLLPGDAPRAAAPGDRDDAARDDLRPGTLAAVPACPHCQQPVAVVAWLVPPAAASVATPPRHADTIRDSR
jgi:endogenous inhibitor of DNA gyrase (YacG/DUF329 family)